MGAEAGAETEARATIRSAGGGGSWIAAGTSPTGLAAASMGVSADAGADAVSAGTSATGALGTSGGPAGSGAVAVSGVPAAGTDSLVAAAGSLSEDVAEPGDENGVKPYVS